MGITKFIFQNLMGWKIVGSFNPQIKKAVVIVVPHTSWHDFYIGALARRIVKTQINYIAKKELFQGPLGRYFKWMGGAPLDRTPGQKQVEAIAEIFKKRDEFRLALAPEGTRKKVTNWKTGYYYIAMAAKVPIICVSFDYGKKVVTINKPFYPMGNIDKDTTELRDFFKGVVGKKPEFS